MLKRMKKNVVLIFPNFSHVHIYKDVGMVPIWLSKTGKYSVKIATESGETFREHKILDEVSVDKIQKCFRRQTLNAVVYIAKNFKYIDVLHLYHFTPSTILLCITHFIFCFFNGKEYVSFIKMDISEEWMKIFRNRPLRPIIKIFGKLFTHASVELREDFEELNSIMVFKNLYHIGNSFALPDKYDELSIVNKKNIILHVTRAGSYQKNTEELLSILPALIERYPRWKVYIAGPYTDDIKRKIDDYYDNRIVSSEQLILLGNISSRTELERLFSESKVLIMTSRWEGYPLALVEARRWGLKIISTKIKGFDEIVDGHSCAFGYKSGDTDELLAITSEALKDESYFISGRFDAERIEYAKFNSWPVKLKQLSNDLHNS
jgi:GalNAc-alpha-(1->4)-GalNAc-alpha-(1->3)-diNAcBac-PP-undecaprenol alpha-1,4-N-acetyl-D-galactosaminyltransferase